MEDGETDHVKNVEEHVKIWEQIKEKEFGSFHVGVCSQISWSLVHLNRLDLMELFLAELGKDRVGECTNNDKFLRALAAFKLKRRQFSDVYDLLREGNFASTNGLLALWDDSHYREKELQLGRGLTPLIRYRIRQKFPPPKNICPDGRRPSSKLPSLAIAALKRWLGDHTDSPYPTQAEKENLSKETRLSLYQVKTWFANARRRLKGRRKEETIKRVLMEKAGNIRAGVQAIANEHHQHSPPSSTGESSANPSNKVVVKAQQECHLALVTQRIKDAIKRPRVDSEMSTSASVTVGQPSRDTGHRQSPLVYCPRFHSQSRAQPFWPQVADTPKNSPDNGAPFPFIWPPQLSPTEPSELNASRSLQALAGMCDGLKTQPYLQAGNAIPEAQGIGAVPNAYDNMANCSKGNATESYLQDPYPDKPCPKENGLWQPFKSTENLRANLPSVTTEAHREHIQNIQPPTIPVPPPAPPPSQKTPSPVQTRPFGTEDNPCQQQQDIQQADTCIKNLRPPGYGDLSPIYRRRHDGNPYILPFPYFSPPSGIPFRFPISPISARQYLPPNAKERSFCDPILTNTVGPGPFSPLMTPLPGLTDINMGSDIVYFPLMSNGHTDHGMNVPFPRFSRDLAPLEHNTTEAAQVLLDLSKHRTTLLSPDISYRE